MFLERNGEAARALELFARAVEAYRAGSGVDHAYTAIVESNHARLLASTGAVAEATALFRHALGVLEDTDFDPALAAQPSLDFGALLVDTGDYEGAEPLLAHAIELWGTTRPEDDDDMLRARTLRAVALTHLGRVGEAEGELVVALERLTAKHGPQHEATREAVGHLVALYEATGRSEEVAALRERND